MTESLRMRIHRLKSLLFPEVEHGPLPTHKDAEDSIFSVSVFYPVFRHQDTEYDFLWEWLCPCLGRPHWFHFSGYVGGDLSSLNK